MIHKILVASDFSAHARRALDYGVAFARLFEAEIELMHAVTLAPTNAPGGAPLPSDLIGQLRKEALSQLEGLAAPLREDGLQVTCRAQHGSASDCVRREAAEGGADLIALGTHGHTGLTRFMLGSTAERTARLAECPVLGVHADTPAPSEFRRILVATDFSFDAVAAIEWATGLVRKSGGRLSLVHSVDPPWWAQEGTDAGDRFLEEGGRAARRELERARDALARADLDADIEVVHGPADIRVLEVAERDGADLIVTGCRGRTGLMHVLLGSQAERILRRAPSPVVVVKAK